MPLYIRDDDVDALAVQVQHLIQARSKTEAVRIALQHEIERSRETVPLRERLAKVKAMAREIGLPNPGFDMKTFSDAMWDGE
jgi:antitoxin VapB